MHNNKPAVQKPSSSLINQGFPLPDSLSCAHHTCTHHSRPTPTLRVLVHGAGWGAHATVTALPQGHALHLGEAGLLAHALLMHALHRLRTDRQTHTTHTYILISAISALAITARPEIRTSLMKSLGEVSHCVHEASPV